MIKNIALNGGIETVTAIFGTGDIKVTHGVCPEEKTPMIYLCNGEKSEIGVTTNEGLIEDEEGNARVGSDGIRFIFPKKESIDVLIDHLNGCKELFDIAPEKRIAKVKMGYIK